MSNVFRIFIVFSFIGILGISVSGCGKQTRYKVLTFFFTGVPSLETQKTTTRKGDKIKKKTRRVVQRPFIHGPRASGECFFCHDTESSLSFRETKLGPGIRNLSEITPGRLVKARNKICVQCHMSKSAELLFTENLWVHGPVSDGLCGPCHDYHQTKNQYMLVRASSIDLCTQCHAKQYIMQTEAHQTNAECITCHNPHIGTSRLLLRKDFDEVF